MVLPLSFLQVAKLALPFALLAKSVLGSLSQNSAFNIKAHGTGFRYASSVSSDDIGVSKIGLIHDSPLRLFERRGP